MRALGDLHDLLGHFVFTDFGDFADDLDAVDRLKFDRRDDFVGQREFEVGFGSEDLLGFVLVFGHGDFRLGGRLFAAAGEDLRRLVANDLVDEIGHDRLAVHLLQVRWRDLAGTEAVDLDLVLNLCKALVHAAFHVLGRNYDLDFALQPFSQRFDNLHFLNLHFVAAVPRQPFVSMSTTPDRRPGVAFMQFSNILQEAKWRVFSQAFG